MDASATRDFQSALRSIRKGQPIGEGSELKESRTANETVTRQSDAVRNRLFNTRMKSGRQTNKDIELQEGR